jgi:hypothetical protein
MRKGGIAPGHRLHIGGVGSLSLFYIIDRIPSFDIRHSAVLRFAFHYLPSATRQSGFVVTFLLTVYAAAVLLAIHSQIL